MKPTMNMDTSVKCLGIQSNLKVAELDEIIIHDYKKKNKQWSSNLTSSFTTTFAEGIISKIYSHASSYSAKRIGIDLFEVTYDPHTQTTQEMSQLDGPEFNDVPYPRFRRIRKVGIKSDRTMVCDCCRFNGCGIFCEHQVAVAKYVYEAHDESFPGFTHHDIIVQYWSAYMHLAYRDSTPDELRKNLHILACNPIEGPKLRIGIPEECPIEEMEPTKDAIDRLINYEKEKLNLDLSTFDGFFSQTYDRNDFSGENDNDVFMTQFNWISNEIMQTTEDSFSASLRDCDFPGEIDKTTRTRDALKQLWESTCSLTDDMGNDKATAQSILRDHLKEFQRYCHDARAKNDTTSKGTGEGDTVPMTGGKYKGTKPRIFNTHHMP